MFYSRGVDLDYGVIDADNHYYEALDAFTRHLDPAMAKRCMQWADVNGKRRLLVGGKINNFLPNPVFDPIAKPGRLEDYFRGHHASGPDPHTMFGAPPPLSPPPRTRDPAPPHASRPGVFVESKRCLRLAKLGERRRHVDTFRRYRPHIATKAQVPSVFLDLTVVDQAEL